MDRVVAPKEEQEELVRKFQRYAKKIDKTDGVYYLGLKEMAKLFKDHEMALAADDVSTVFQMIDEDGDGKISQDEFVSALTDRTGLPTPQNCRSLFDRLDIIKDGALRFNELEKEMGEHLSNGLLKVIYNELDTDKSGRVTFVQFLDFFRN